ncbi:hypothetical protein D9M73_283660 [compost metagenome]
MGAVVHQVTAEVAFQLIGEQALLLGEHHPADRPGEPVAGLSDQPQPIGIGVGKGLLFDHHHPLTGCHAARMDRHRTAYPH